MPELLQIWYLFPVSILIATIAMTSGIGGAVFFSPLFILFLDMKLFISGLFFFAGSFLLVTLFLPG